MRRSDWRRPTTTTAALLLLAFAGCGDGGTQPNAPSGTLLVTTFDGEHEAIEVVRADGRGRRRLTAAGISEFDAAWSPDGRRIAFIRQAPNESAHLFVMNADGSD